MTTHMNTQPQTIPEDFTLSAEQIARKAHGGQFRRDGVTPYISHPEAVAHELKSEGAEAVAVAWLHDALEDTDMTPGCLRDAGMPESVIQAVCDLTHKRDESYADYLQRVKRNPLATKVKVEDMLHNLSDAPTKNQILKYADGLLTLLTHMNAISNNPKSDSSSDGYADFAQLQKVLDQWRTSAKLYEHQIADMKRKEGIADYADSYGYGFLRGALNTARCCISDLERVMAKEKNA